MWNHFALLRCAKTENDDDNNSEKKNIKFSIVNNDNDLSRNPKNESVGRVSCHWLMNFGGSWIKVCCWSVARLSIKSKEDDALASQKRKTRELNPRNKVINTLWRSRRNLLFSADGVCFMSIREARWCEVGMKKHSQAGLKCCFP